MVVTELGTPFDNLRCDSFGASIEALRILGESKGYELVHCDSAGVNAVFVAREHMAGTGGFLGITDRTPNYYLSGCGHAPHPVRATMTPPDPFDEERSSR